MSVFDKQIAELNEKNRELEAEQKAITERKDKEEPIRAEWRKLKNDPKYIKREKCQNRKTFIFIFLAIAVLITIVGAIFAKNIPLILIVGICLTALSVFMVINNITTVKRLNNELKDVDDQISILLGQLDTKSNMRSFAIVKEIAENKRKIVELEKKKEEAAVAERFNQEHAQFAKNHVFVHVSDETSSGLRNLTHWVFIDGQEYGVTSRPFSKYELNPGVHNIKLCYKISDSIYQTQTVTFRVDERSKMFSYKYKGYSGIDFREFDDLYVFLKYLQVDISNL